MKLHAHHDPVALETALLDGLEAVEGKAAVSPRLVVVPTRRLADHVSRAAIRRRPAWIGLEIVTLRALALQIVEGHSPVRPIVLSTRLRRSILTRVAAALDETPLGTFLDRRPGAIGRLAGAIDELRDAGVAPRELRAAARGARETALADLYGSYVQRLEHLGLSGDLDDAALARLASEHAAAFAARYDAIFVHGLIEPIGVHLELLRALDAGRSLVGYFPADDEAPAYRFAERRLAALGSEIERIDAPARPELLALFDEEATPEPIEVRRAHVHGPAAEVAQAISGALERIAAGAAPDSIAIVARGLEEHAGPLEAALAGAGLPWTGSLAMPLRRFPVVRDLLRALELVETDFPRRETAEWLRSPRVAWSALAGRPVQVRRERVEAWSRQARLLGGLDEWTRGLSDWAAASARHRDDDDAVEERRRQAADIGELLLGLARRLPTSRLGWHQHAAHLEKLLDEVLTTDADDAAVSELRRLLSDLAANSRIAPEERTPLSEVRRWLEEAVDATTLPIATRDDGGIRVLDAMQARGLTFDHVFLIGMNAGSFPRGSRDDPFLTEPLRARLREATGRPVGSAAERLDEERLLLAQTIGASRDGLTVSWQRADESGRSRTPSMALREIARLALGRPDLEAFVASAEHVSSHPRQAIEGRIDRFSAISPDERRVAAALDTREADRARLGEQFPELRDGVHMLVETQTFRPTSMAFDGRVPPDAMDGGPRAPLGVSAFELLGKCPRQFLFRHVFRVPELDSEPDPYVLEPRELGSFVHDAMEQLYESLRKDGTLPWEERVVQPSLFPTDADAAADEPATDRPGPADAAAVDRAVEHSVATLRALGDDLFGAFGRRLAARLPVLWQRVRQEWLDELERFVRDDVTRTLTDGWRFVGLEEPFDATLHVSDQVAIALRGRYDRALRSASGDLLVTDYKTSGKVQSRYAKQLDMLRGRQLQVPLYRRLTGASEVEVVGLNPNGVERRGSFGGFGKPDVEEGFERTLITLQTLRDRGVFPLHENHENDGFGSPCGFCAYRPACRRVHPPTSVRERRAQDAAEFHGLAAKTMKNPSPKRRDEDRTEEARA